MPREISAGAVIFRRDNDEISYLLLHYRSGHWDFPKGHVEKGETEEETVKREVAEETGIKDIKIIKGFKKWIKYAFRQVYDLEEEKGKKAPWVFKRVTFYLAETKTDKVKISYEHTGYKWLPYDEALEQLTFQNAKEILKKANDFLTN